MCHDESGTTVRGEIGFGVGLEVNIDPLGNPNEEKGFSGEVGVAVGVALNYGVVNGNIDVGVTADPAKGTSIHIVDAPTI